MECPACKNELTEHKVSSIKVDICQGACGGIWINYSQIKKIEHLKPGAGAELLAGALGAVLAEPSMASSCPSHMKTDPLQCIQHASLGRKGCLQEGHRKVAYLEHLSEGITFLFQLYPQASIGHVKRNGPLLVV